MGAEKWAVESIREQVGYADLALGDLRGQIQIGRAPCALPGKGGGNPRTVKFVRLRSQMARVSSSMDPLMERI